MLVVPGRVQVSLSRDLQEERFEASRGASARTQASVDLRELKKRAADEVELRILQEQLNRNSGDVRAVSEALGSTPRAVYQKLSYHGSGNDRETGMVPG